jgi:hypothetical protein
MPIPSSAGYPGLQELAARLNAVNRQAFASEVASHTGVVPNRAYHMRHAIATWRSLNAYELAGRISEVMQQFRRDAGVGANVIQLPAWVIACMQRESSEPLVTWLGMQVRITPNDGSEWEYVQLNYEPPRTPRQPMIPIDPAWSDEVSNYDINALCAPFPDPGHQLDATRYTHPTLVGSANGTGGRSSAPDSVPNTRASASCSPANLYGYGRWSKSQRAMDR